MFSHHCRRYYKEGDVSLGQYLMRAWTESEGDMQRGRDMVRSYTHNNGPSSSPPHSTLEYPFARDKGVLNGYSSTRVSLWASLMFGRLAMGFANVRAGTRVLMLVLVQAAIGRSAEQAAGWRRGAR